MPDGFTLLSQQPTLSPTRLPPLPDTTPKTKVPSLATRRAACTHLTMDRLYGDFTCHVCSRYPSLGWVYCCTQDEIPDTPATPDSVSGSSSPSHGHVNASGDEADVVHDPSMPQSAVDEDRGSGGENTMMPTAQLSPWIDKAINDGHYTSEQIVKLRAQKQHVVDTAKAAVHQFEQSQFNNTSPSPQTPTTLQSIDMSSQLPFINSFSTKGTSAQRTNGRMFPFCKFCACHLCRPNHRERTWQHFDDVFESDYEIPFIHYEDRNRPLASRSIMSTIGLRPPRVPQRPQLRSTDSTALYSRNEAGQIFFNNNNDSYRKCADTPSSSADIADANTEAESKGFRESMKRAFKGMLTARQTGSRPSSLSSTSNSRKRKARDGTDTTDEDAVEFDMGLWKELNDELLREASGVPLPVGTDSIDRLSRDVAGMGRGIGGGTVGGVAVTEEAADLGTADVIMSV